MNSGFKRCAVPAFGQNVAPRYDVAALFKVFELDVGQPRMVGTLNASGLDSEARLALLVGARVDVLVCGGIRRFDLLRLNSAGIRVFPGVRGAIDWAVGACVSGGLRQWMPGAGKGRGPWGRRNRRNR